MRRIIIFSTAGLVALGGINAAHAASSPAPIPLSGLANNNLVVNPATGTAQLATIKASGITGTLRFADDGNSMTAQGTATGFQPFRQYVSFAYGLNSTATGATPCAADGSLNFAQMLVGEWLPIGSASRTLVGVLPVTRLAYIKTTSIRLLNTTNLTAINFTNPLAPQLAQLQACGLIVKANPGAGAPTPVGGLPPRSGSLPSLPGLTLPGPGGPLQGLTTTGNNPTGR